MNMEEILLKILNEQERMAKKQETIYSLIDRMYDNVEDIKFRINDIYHQN